MLWKSNDTPTRIRVPTAQGKHREFGNCVKTQEFCKNTGNFVCLRIDKGSRCVLRYTYILLITLMAFVLL